MFTRILLLKFWLVVGLIYLTSWIVPGFHVTWLAGMYLAILMTAIVALIETIAGSQYVPNAPGILAWASGTIILYCGQWILPGIHATIFGSILAGTVLWAVSFLVPRIWG